MSPDRKHLPSCLHLHATPTGLQKDTLHGNYNVTDRLTNGGNNHFKDRLTNGGNNIDRLMNGGKKLLQTDRLTD